MAEVVHKFRFTIAGGVYRITHSGTVASSIDSAGGTVMAIGILLVLIGLWLLINTFNGNLPDVIGGKKKIVL